MGNNSKKERKEETDAEQEETREEGEKSTPEKNTEAKKRYRLNNLNEVVISTQIVLF